MKSYRIGIDIGGTKVAYGLVTEEGTVARYDAVATPACGNDGAGFAQVLCHKLQQFIKQCGVTLEQVRHLGIGIPGTADTRRGISLYCPNLFGMVPVPLADLFEARLGIRPSVVQDSWAAAYAEYVFGGNRAHPNMICVTVGTGIGCGVLLNGSVFGGALGTAGELGHTPIVYGGRACSCGRQGCLERYISGTAILAQAMERFPQKLAGMSAKAESVFLLASEGDREALSLIAECVDKLAYGIAIAIGLLAVDTVVISGGLSKQKALIIDPLEENIRAYAYPPWAGNGRLQVLPAALGHQAPVVGAAFLTYEQIT